MVRDWSHFVGKDGSELNIYKLPIILTSEVKKLLKSYTYSYLCT